MIQEPLPDWPLTGVIQKPLPAPPPTAITSTPEMVERVATMLADHPHASFVELARFAIAAMREPTWPMCLAAWRDSMAERGITAKTVWKEMVDEALR